jgi:glyceraldehyde 3-phosphate dehydrogenase
LQQDEEENAMKVAINDFGRIGRTLFKQLLDAGGFDVVAVKDIASADDLAYALKFDTVRGRYSRDVELAGNRLMVDGRTSRILGERDPAPAAMGRAQCRVGFRVHQPVHECCRS